VGIFVGIAIAIGTRGADKKPSGGTAANLPSAAPTGSVMTLPTIDMTDDNDGGN